MKRFFLLALPWLLTGLWSATAMAEDPGAEKVRASLKVLVPHLEVDSVSPSPIPGLYEVAFGTHIIYVTEDGKYLVQGKITDLETREPITENHLKMRKQALLKRLDEKDMIVYGDKELPYTVTVFTDIDCPYCRRLHSQIDEYNRNGIRIRYLAYPRAGPGSPSERKAMAVWCAKDRKQAMTDAKSGKSVPYEDCDNPVRAQYRLGQDFGISGTPALILDDGEIIPGYVPPKRLRAVLDRHKAEMGKN
ncbi:MAG: bifunctional protein-disulfide isomerase/oxidoreductase DsbC [Gammaproteobacteria bacterium]|nr:MAG: bifunctional protein-disulfide isomerase/oxidoreductase DsbC [Gammaproteobacteria bacterium]